MNIQDSVNAPVVRARLLWDLPTHSMVWTGDVSAYFRHLSTCRAFRNICAHGPHNLRGMRDSDKVGQDDSIWTTIDINAYHEASALGVLSLTLLPRGRLVSSTMVENPNPQYTPRSLPTDDTIMGGLEPNAWIRDRSNMSHILMLSPEDDGFFTMHHLSVE